MSALAATSSAPRRVPVPLPSPWFWGLVVLYVLLGLVGHDPWKGDDLVGFGIAWGMANGGDWLRPAVAGQLVAEEGPVAFWLAALFIKAFGTWLQPHDAARLATGFWTSIAIIGVHRASRALDGAASSRLAVLALLACLGLLLRSHEIAAEPAFLAGWSLVLWALALDPAGSNSGLRRAALLAAGMCMCLLGRGVVATAPVVLTCLVWAGVEAFGPRKAGRAAPYIAAGLALGVAAGAWWPVAGPKPDAFATAYAAWQAAQFGVPDSAAWRYYGKTIFWFTFPAWPVALWWIAKRRPRKFLDVHPVPLVQKLPLVALTCVLMSIASSPRAGDAVMLPLLPPLALLIAPGLAYMRRGQAALIDWFGRMTFTIVAALIWLGYLALQTGWPPRIAANFARREPGFVAGLEWPTLAIAGIATLAWVVAIARSERTPLRGIVHWCYGTTLTWLLLMTLWLPWIDYGRSYRPVAISMKAAMSGRGGLGRACVETFELGLSERTSLAYFGAIRFQTIGENCPWLLMQGIRTDNPRPPPGMRLVWEGNRPGDRDERFRLYRRIK